MPPAREDLSHPESVVLPLPGITCQIELGSTGQILLPSVIVLVRHHMMVLPMEG
jgi:hypothetical protein